MSETDQIQEPEETKAAPETLELRARPQPVTRINRKVLIGGAAVFLMLLSGIVLVALKPPSLKVAERQELINVENKPITDGLSKLPATYEGVRPANPAPQSTPPAVPKLILPDTGLPLDDAESAEKARIARMAGQARESQVFFRLQLKQPPQDSTPSGAQSEPTPRSSTPTADGGLATLSLLRATERAQALATGELEYTGTDPTEATRKLAFLKSGPDKEIYNPHGLQTPASPFQLMAGTVIAASLITGLNSGLPGFVTAQVTENIYDTVSGRFLLIPQGTRLIGKYDNVVAFGQERALVVWQRIILPDGSSVVIDNLPATDTGGYAGLADEVDLHTWKLLKGVALATVLGVGSELAFGSSDSDLIRALQLSTQTTTNRAGQRLIERNLNVQPTITVRPGWPLRVIVHKDIVLRPYRASAAN
ncbi:TrbI/VirB10 family protein [Hyphomicrobium sp. DMF-1]|jgi:type IV secretory pathway VirB10-like protein|uniref:TrbI/VirB10 family protein n=1 Tax=Hyphomicrobium sp. DMF-1 TaxID=3019544 RepID=UPI0022EBF9BA|nr:TrbI/VirB10 family protein [Hyphomicrobium sp. DMF-1]WBT38967.1 conjugal transfer protein TraI [Hyphomicrobium sp. DMF-1]